MTTSSYSATFDNTSAITAWNWMNPIHAFMSAAGWTQTADTGQMVWPGSIVSISAASWNGTTATYTYTLGQGPSLQVGDSITITNTTTSGLSGTFIITGTPLSTTFTCANTTSAGSESETAFGVTNVQAAITHASGNGTTASYTYTNNTGTITPGQSVVITGCTNSGFNGTFTVLTVSGGVFTCANTTNATEAESGALGTVAANTANTTHSASTLPPSSNNFLYEIWQMTDSLATTDPVLLKVCYGTGASANADPWLSVYVARSTNGAGSVVIGTGQIYVTPESGSSQSTSAFNCYLSGSTNRMTWCLYPNDTSTTLARGFFTIERAHNSSGGDIGVANGGYVTYITINPASAVPTVTQQSLTLTALTTAEIKLAALQVHSTGTGSFGNSTCLSPVFPLVGAVGNPMIGVLIGKAADWTDGTQFTLNIYGTSHIYQVTNTSFTSTANALTSDVLGTNCLIFRFE